MQIGCKKSISPTLFKSVIGYFNEEVDFLFNLFNSLLALRI